MANETNGSEPLLEDLEELRPVGEIEDADRRRRKDLDRESARAVKGGATRGKRFVLSAVEHTTIRYAHSGGALLHPGLLHAESAIRKRAPTMSLGACIIPVLTTIHTAVVCSLSQHRQYRSSCTGRTSCLDKAKAAF